MEQSSKAFDRPIRFGFDAKKAAQAAGKILALSGGARNYMELIKLLFLADREALLRLERPITGDSVVAMRHGFVLSRILDLIKWGPCDEDDAPWFEMVSAPEGYTVKLVKHAVEDDELSGAEIKVLNEVFEKYGRTDWKALSRLTHGLPEWVDPGGGSIPVPPEQILKLNGASPAEIERLKAEVFAYARLDRDAMECREQERAAILGE